MTSATERPGRRKNRTGIRTLVRSIWRWKWVTALLVVLAAGATFVVAERQPKHYVASARVYVATFDPVAAAESSQPPGPPSTRNMEDLATLFTAQAVTAVVDKQVGVTVGSSAAGSVSVAPLKGAGSASTSFLVVTATADSAGLAARLANTYVAAFLASRRATEAAEATQALHTLAVIPANVSSQLRALARNPSAGAIQTNTALAPNAANSPKPARDALLGAIAGLILGLGISVAVALIDKRLTRVSTVEAAVGVAALAVLPHTRTPTTMRDGHATIPQDFVEPMRGLRINLAMTFGEHRHRTLLVTSGLPGEGKSTVVRDLALTYAEAGESVLVVDADLRRPSLASMFGIDTRPGSAAVTARGLAQVLRREVLLTAAVLPVLCTSSPLMSESAANWTSAEPESQRRGSIDLLNYGEQVASPGELFGSSGMKSLLETATLKYSAVIIDSAPLLAVADTLPLLSVVDGVLLVARLGRTTRESADRLHAILQRVPSANVVGLVTNDLRRSFPDEGYGAYGREYGYEERHDGRGGAQPYSATTSAYTPLAPSDSD